MKYIKNYNSFNSVNEELIGNIVNFFKNLWAKAIEEFKKLGENPSIDDIKKWILKNPFNPQDNNYLFKNILNDFKNKENINDQDSLDLINSILNPETGLLGKQGLNDLFENLKKLYLKKGEKTNYIICCFEYIFKSVRDRAISQYKFAGGLVDDKIDQKKINTDIKDVIHLPDIKKLLLTSKDSKSKKELTINWCNKTLFPMMEKYINSISEEEINKYIKSKNIKGPSSNEVDYNTLLELYNKKIPVIYLLKGRNKNDWDKLTINERNNPTKPPASNIVGVKVINAINDQDTEESVTFIDKDGNPTIKKAYKDIIGKYQEVKSDQAKNAAKELGKIKNDPEKMKKISNYAQFLKNDDNKEKVDQIEKIIKGS